MTGRSNSSSSRARPVEGDGPDRPLGGAASGGETYKEVRALTRGVRVLEALAELGWARPSALAAHTGIDRSTVYRLAHTLVAAGFLTERREDGAFALTSRVAQIAQGIRHDDLAGQIALPHLRALTAKVLWPSDFAVLNAGVVSIQVSTHNLSAMTIHRAMVGKTRPLLRSALGRAILSASSDEEVARILDVVERQGGSDAREANFRLGVRRMLAETRERGHAVSTGAIEAGISALALPVRGPGRVAGAVNIIYFRSVMTQEAAAAAHLDDLRACVTAIEADLAAALRPLPAGGAEGARDVP